MMAECLQIFLSFDKTDLNKKKFPGHDQNHNPLSAQSHKQNAKKSYLARKWQLAANVYLINLKV